MIKVIDFGGQVKYLNPDLIERIESVPDTLLILVNGSRHRVRGSADEIVQEIVAFRRHISCGSHQQAIPVREMVSTSAVDEGNAAETDTFEEKSEGGPSPQPKCR